MNGTHLLVLTLSNATPLLLACYGGLLSELSGVINFALEGMMLSGAFGAVWGTSVSGSPWLGLLCGTLAGALIGSLHALASLVFRANQIVSSIALNIFAAGVTGMLLHQVFHVYGTSPSVPPLPTLRLESLGKDLLNNTGTGGGLAELSIMVPVALALGFMVILFFKHTTPGWRIRACGENPKATQAAGLSVFWTRLSAVTLSGALAGLGGVSLSIGVLSQFVENMTQGRGYLAIAALILGSWKPGKVMFAALFFGFGQALSEQLAVRWSQFPYQLFLALPYLICLLVLILPGRHQRPPSALGQLS